ncbi:MAG TPA: AMP-binding protein [Candidatus Dormibacteraeota bacterium]|nr:AMP-binding protein [Candidatus Dormibacteraeota bacterium]
MSEGRAVNRAGLTSPQTRIATPALEERELAHAAPPEARPLADTPPGVPGCPVGAAPTAAAPTGLPGPDPGVATRLSRLLQTLAARNQFYRDAWRAAGLDLLAVPGLSLDQLPFTTKAELVRDQLAHPPFGRNHTFPLATYTRVHQTSGTTGRPLRVLDTAASWRWWGRCWTAVYRGAEVSRRDRVFLAFSFGPFIGFWAALEGAAQLGAMTITGGGMDSVLRLQAMADFGATVLVATPSYALHLARVARAEGIDPHSLGIRTTIHAGEPGASVPAVRARIEELWGARCHDHAGASEIGAWGYSCREGTGLHVIATEFIAEVIDPATAAPVADGTLGELVLTNLGRPGFPAVRYRTGDMVRRVWQRCPCGREGPLLAGGVLGRADDMLVVRGMNIFPSAIDALVREHRQIGEYEVRVWTRGDLDQLTIRAELDSDDPAGVAEELMAHCHHRLGMRVGFEALPPGTLPPTELKARRIRDERAAAPG